MRDFLNLGLRLLLICAISAGLLGATYSVTKDPIAQHLAEASVAANKAVCSEASDFKEMNMSDLQSQAGWNDSFADVTQVLEGQKEGKTVGYVLKVNGTGYAGLIAMTVGVSPDGKYTGVSIDSQNETAGLGANATQESFRSQYVGKSSDQEITVSKTPTTKDTEIQAISGATITSRAVTKAINVAGQFAQAFLVGK
ncbi:MAG: RnfABCDGE type electron transport complex subunit G [Bacillota bacterium]